MKKTIILALLAISMAACTNQAKESAPQRCELFNVHLGMTYDEVNGILTERFGKGESQDEPEFIYYEDIFHDGIKYSIASFVFRNDKLIQIYCHCDKEVDFSDIKQRENNERDVWLNIHEVDSMLAQRHKVYHNPVTQGLTDGNVVSLATKDVNNMVDFISVRVSRHKWSYNNTESVSLILDLTELEKQL